MKIGSIDVGWGLFEDQIDEEIGSYGSTEEFGLKSRGEIMFFGHKRTGSDWILLMKTNHDVRKEGSPRLIVIVADLWIRKGETIRGLKNLNKEGGGKVYGQIDSIDLSRYAWFELGKSIKKEIRTLFTNDPAMLSYKGAVESQGRELGVDGNGNNRRQGHQVPRNRDYKGKGIAFDNSKYEGNSKSGFKRSYRDQDGGYSRNLRQTGRFPPSEAPMRYAMDTRGLKNLNAQEMGQNLDEQQKLMLDAFRSGKSEETNKISASTARKALTFEGNISGTAMEGLGGTDVASGIEGASVGEEDPKAVEEKLLPDRHGADKQKDFNKEESEGEKIEEMEGLSEEIYSELTGDAALTETGEQDGSEHVGDEVFAEADFDMEEDDQLMETETQEVLIAAEGKERGGGNKKKQGKVNGAAMGGSLKKRLVQSVVSPRKKHSVKHGSKVGEKGALPPKKAPVKPVVDGNILIETRAQWWWLWSCVTGSIWSVLLLQCNRMFLFWTRHFAITMFIEIIKEHHLLQIVMKHLNWRNGYWLVLSCIKSRFSLVEYQGLMLLVSCGGIFIYMARSHTEHRALVSWPMGLSGGHWYYITREMKYVWLLFLNLYFKCEQWWWVWFGVTGSSWICWIRLFVSEFFEIVKVFQPFQAVIEFNWCTVFWMVLSCAKNRSLLGDYLLFCFPWRFGVCLSSDGILLNRCHCGFLSIWIHWWLTTSYCPGVYLTDGGWHLRKRTEDMALYSFCKTYKNPYMGHQSMEWSIYGSNDLRKDNLNYAKHYISVVLWQRDLKNLQMQIRCLVDRKTLSAYILVCRVTASVKIKHFYDFCVEIWSSKDTMYWVM
ncbi:hypothetical protein IGI04_040381, partial [Brassica rapa subsp. trilocularis]